MLLTIQRPLRTPAPLPPVRPPAPTGLYAQWQVVDGRLTCVWLKYPD